MLQWPARTEADYERLLLLEETLLSDLEGCDVDGHDLGSGEMNLFILTDAPRRTFSDARRVIERASMTPGLRAAFRDVESDVYEVVWPSGSTGFTVR